ncbi:hypothetical protein [Burkholderia sp. AW49-1]
MSKRFIGIARIRWTSNSAGGHWAATIDRLTHKLSIVKRQQLGKRREQVN